MIPSARSSNLTLRKSVIVLVIVVVLLAIGGAGWWVARILFDPQYNLTVADVMHSESDATDITTDPVEITQSGCGPDIACVEAYDTLEAVYFRFSQRSEATAFANTLDDGFQSNYIVMDFAGKTSVEKQHQLWAMQNLAGMWNDYNGQFPDR